ncbi:MAG: hypothetical protein ACR2KX_19860 [Chitinophagaceae bacterium]
MLIDICRSVSTPDCSGKPAESPLPASPISGGVGSGATVADLQRKAGQILIGVPGWCSKEIISANFN